MAYTKIHAIKSTPGKALDYIENPDKTEDQLLVSGYNVDPLSASLEFAMTRAMAKQALGDRVRSGAEGVLAYHMIQSFAPSDNVTPEQAHELGKRLANELLEGKHEYVISTHVDKGHIHNHIIFNATSFYSFRKFRTQPYRTASRIRAISDRICAEADLSVIKGARQLGRAYEYKGLKQGPSWKRQIRRRLQFVLEAAGSFEEFEDGVARLGVTVDASKKYVTYRMDGQERNTRDRALDKDGAFSKKGILEQIEANTEVREHLKAGIREAAAAATDMKDFQGELQKRGIQAKETRKNGMIYTVDGEVTVREWALGLAYSTERIQAAIRERGAVEFPEDGSALDSIVEEFQKTNQSHAQEVPISVNRDQVVKTIGAGILMAVPDEKAGSGQMVFIDRDHITYRQETDSFTVYIGNGYNYYMGTADGERTGVTVKGENIIRALELANGVEPERVDVAPEDVKAVSPKGLTISMPELGISSLFVEDRFVEYDRLGGGSAMVKIYDDWSYRFQAADGSTKYLAGNELTGHLKQRQTSGLNSLWSRINAMQRRSKLAETKHLANTLLLIRQEGIQSMEDFTPRLADLQRKLESIQGSIEEIQARNAAYQTAAKYLVTYNTYLPVKLESMTLSGWERKKFETAHESELSAWAFAGKELERSGVKAEVDPEKVMELVREQEQELAGLKTQADELAQRAMALENARREIQQLREDDRQSEQPRQRGGQDQTL